MMLVRPASEVKAVRARQVGTAPTTNTSFPLPLPRLPLPLPSLSDHGDCSLTSVSSAIICSSRSSFLASKGLPHPYFNNAEQTPSVERSLSAVHTTQDVVLRAS